MHDSSLIVAGVLAIMGVLFAAQNGKGYKNTGMVFAGLAALMFIAGVTA